MKTNQKKKNKMCCGERERIQKNQPNIFEYQGGILLNHRFEFLETKQSTNFYLLHLLLRHIVIALFILDLNTIK